MSENNKKYTLGQLAELTYSQLIGDANYCITGIEALESASVEDAAFLANPRYLAAMIDSKAGVICVGSQISLPEGKNFLVSDNPSRAFQKIAETLLVFDFNSPSFIGIHPTAFIHPTVILGEKVHIGPYAVIDQGAKIGDGTQIGPHVSIGPGVEIGKQCFLHPHVVIRERCQLGNRVILQPGAVIGSCGFGYTTDAKGEHSKLEQLGIVIIEDDVEIGANTTIDRGRFKATRIGRGTKIDNLVQIGHNVCIGPNNIIVSQTGIAGSTKTGRNVVFGGQAGVVGHLQLGDGVMIATRGGVSKSLPKAGKYAGSPVIPLADYNRQQVQLRNINKVLNELEELKKRLACLEQSTSS